MVDVAIAANFVRELTEEQFTEQRRSGPRRVAEQRPRVSGSAAAPSVNGSDPARASARSEPTRGRRARNETTGLRRALARFAQVRG